MALNISTYSPQQQNIQNNTLLMELQTINILPLSDFNVFNLKLRCEMVDIDDTLYHFYFAYEETEECHGKHINDQYYHNFVWFKIKTLGMLKRQIQKNIFNAFVSKPKPKPPYYH